MCAHRIETHPGAFERPAPEVVVPRSVDRATHQAQGILKFAFTLLPIVAGLDKFFHQLVDWDRYVSPFVSRIVGGNDHTFMLAVGVAEIVVGLGVALAPRFFGYVLAAWLWGIIVNLLLVPGYYDIVARDFALSLGALALAKLSHHVHSPVDPRIAREPRPEVRP